jgi:hypothetical protein
MSASLADARRGGGRQNCRPLKTIPSVRALSRPGKQLRSYEQIGWFRGVGCLIGYYCGYASCPASQPASFIDAVVASRIAPSQNANYFIFNRGRTKWKSAKLPMGYVCGSQRAPGRQRDRILILGKTAAGASIQPGLSLGAVF